MWEMLERLSRAVGVGDNVSSVARLQELDLIELGGDGVRVPTAKAKLRAV